MVSIRYHGHSCFEIRLGNGTTIVIDPHDGYSIGLEPPRVKADIVLVTHDHFDHNAVKVVSGERTRVVMELDGLVDMEGLRIHGYRAPHDREEGKRRGMVTVYIVEAEGLRIAHLGDIGVVPSGRLAESLCGVDVLMIPVGGVYTIDPDEAWKTIQLLDPWIAIPMHYWTPGLTLPLYRLEDFLAYVKKRRVVRTGDTYTVETRPSEKTVLVMQRARATK